MNRNEIMELLFDNYDNLDLLGIIKDNLDIILNDIEYMNNLYEYKEVYNLGNNYIIKDKDLQSLWNIVDTIKSIEKYNKPWESDKNE